MTDQTITPEEIDELFAKLDALNEGLSEPQKALLAAILKVAVEVQDASVPDPRSFSEQFAAAFKAGQADRVFAYAHFAQPPQPHTDAIIRSLTPSSATPAAIIRSGPVDSDTDTE
ncbi:MAG: hypothetical protein GEV28_14795 [Actinophytocola sp.]|uniref:hypothetical protein n=1 Tax=Actinophytocola sp. TaxID=1872138 RepID=UPI00132B8E39|nr:hypothetical protein [Actinophytocola sp.]MPZ81592.1 hypothetical protein [Actinophytocola sp.]